MTTPDDISTEAVDELLQAINEAIAEADERIGLENLMIDLMEDECL